MKKDIKIDEEGRVEIIEVSPEFLQKLQEFQPYLNGITNFDIQSDTDSNVDQEVKVVVDLRGWIEPYTNLKSLVG